MLRTLYLRSACILVVLFAGSPCSAADGPRFETYVSGDYSGRAAGVDTSTAWSPFGPVDQPGFRVKMDSYANICGEGEAGVFSSAFIAADFAMLADGMIGYQAHWDPFWIKVYAGAASQAQAASVSKLDLGKLAQGSRAAVEVEAFWRGYNRFWLSANAKWLQFDQTILVYERTAYEFIHIDNKFQLSTGFEVGAAVGSGPHLFLQKEFEKEGAILKSCPLVSRADLLGRF